MRRFFVVRGLIFLILLLGLGGYVLYLYLNPPVETWEAGRMPTNFSEIGTVVVNNPGLEPDTPYLIYEKPGEPALSRELKFDPLSFCVVENGGIACLELKTSPEILLGGERVTVEGIENEGTVLVRRIGLVGDREFKAAAGAIYIPWAEAVSLIEKCEVKTHMQAHSLNVDLTLKDGLKVRSVEPRIDEVFGIVEKAVPSCGNFPVATE